MHLLNSTNAIENVHFSQLFGCSFLSFSAVSFTKKRSLFSSNYICIEKNKPLNLKEPLNSYKQPPLSKDAFDLKDKNYETLKLQSNTGDSPNVNNGSEAVKNSLFARFWLNIKNYSRRTMTGVKKGYSVKTISPETEKLLSNP